GQEVARRAAVRTRLALDEQRVEDLPRVFLPPGAQERAGIPQAVRHRLRLLGPGTVKRQRVLQAPRVVERDRQVELARLDLLGERQRTLARRQRRTPRRRRHRDGRLGERRRG